MRFLAALTLSIALLPSTQASAIDVFNPESWFAPSICPMDLPKVTVRSTPSGVVIDQTLDAHGMEEASRTLIGASRAGWTTNGLAIAELRSRADLITNQVKLKDGSWCATLHDAVIGIGYGDPIKVMISKRYEKYSCQYRAVLEHEWLHVDVYRETLAGHLRGVEDRVVELLMAEGPGYGPTAAAASAAVERTVDGIVMEIIEGIKAESDRRNSVLDSDQSYFSIQAQCPGW